MVGQVDHGFVSVVPAKLVDVVVVDLPQGHGALRVNLLHRLGVQLGLVRKKQAWSLSRFFEPILEPSWPASVHT